MLVQQWVQLNAPVPLQDVPQSIRLAQLTSTTKAKSSKVVAASLWKRRVKVSPPSSGAAAGRQAPAEPWGMPAGLGRCSIEFKNSRLPVPSSSGAGGVWGDSVSHYERSVQVGHSILIRNVGLHTESVVHVGQRSNGG